MELTCNCWVHVGRCVKKNKKVNHVRQSAANGPPVVLLCHLVAMPATAWPVVTQDVHPGFVQTKALLESCSSLSPFVLHSV